MTEHTAAERDGCRSRWAVAAVACAVAAAACLLTADHLHRQPPPRPSAAVLATAPPSAPSGPVGAAMPASPPRHLDIPALGMHLDVDPVPLNAEDAITLPANPQHAGWATSTVTPGQAGTAVIVGHVDTTTGPAAFYGLGALTPGATILVQRQDGTTARFTADALSVYPKDAFPSATVYRDTPTPTLRLITCTDWSASAHAYMSNLVVYAHLAPAADGSWTPTPTRPTARRT